MSPINAVKLNLLLQEAPGNKVSIRSLFEVPEGQQNGAPLPGFV